MVNSKLKGMILTGLLAVTFCTLCACNKSTPVANADDEYAPVSSLTMEETEAASLSGKMHFRIYYANASGTKLAPETKFTDYVREFKRPDALAKVMLEQMLMAPQNGNLQKTVPEGTQIHSVIIAGSCATVDLNKAFYESLESAPKTAPLVLASIVTTLTELKEVTYVSFLCDGNAPTISGTFSKLTRNAAIVSASLEITTLAGLTQEVIEAGLALEEEPELE